MVVGRCEKERERERERGREADSNRIERAERARVFEGRATSASVRQQCSFFGELVGVERHRNFR
jgi:hypothetical protein